MNNALLYIGGLLVVVLAALFGLPYAIDWNGYRGVFEEEASRVLGREVRVAGNVGLRLLPSPYVHFEKLRIGGAVGEEAGRPLFRAEGFTMWLSVPPLLKGQIEARDIELRKPAIELAMDAEGRTSLSTLKVMPGSLSFVPDNVALQAVRIIDGSFGLSGPNGVELARLEAINGEMSAESLDGPFKFKGEVAWEGAAREVRIATAKREPDGTLRFKSLVSVPATGNTYTLDAAATGLAEAPVIEGTLTAKISTQGFEIAAPTGDAGVAANAIPAAPVKASFDVTSKVKSAPGRIALDDIAISLQQGSIPQLINGRSAIGWGDRLSLDVDLSSKWLDLDQLTSGPATAGSAGIPLELARTLFDRLVDQLPASADTNVALSVDQVGLGKQAISGLKMTAARAGGALELKDVRASLPGGTNLALDGILEGEAGARAFSGTLALSGQSLSRFTSWGFGDNPFSRSRSDGPFSVEGNLLLSDKAIELTDGSAEINRTPLLGELRLGLEEKRRLAVSLEGHRINLGELWPDNPGLGGLRDMLFVAPPAATQPASAPATGEPKTTNVGLSESDLLIDIKAGELIDGAHKLENVHVDVELLQGRLSVPKIKFNGSSGLLVDLEGAAVDVPAKTRGSLRGVIEAPQPEAVTALAELIGIPDAWRPGIGRWSRLAPWRLATTVSFGERRPEAVDVSLDGVLRGGRAVAKAEIDAARADWRAAPSDFSASIETPDVDAFLDMISETARPKAAAAGARPGKVFVKAAGKAAVGLVVVAEVDAENVALDFNGRLTVPEATALAAKGEIRIDAQDLRRVLALTGVPLAEGAAGVAVAGKIAAAHDGGKLTLAAEALKIGSASVSGVVTHARAEAGAPATIEAELSADSVALPALLAAVTQVGGAPEDKVIALPVQSPAGSKRRPPPAAAEAAPPPRSIWSDAAFDFAPLDGLNGSIKASIRSLALEPGVAMKDARLDLALAPGRIEVRRLEGAVLGGKAVSGFTLERQPAGAALAGNLKINVSSKGSAESDGDDAIEGDVAALSVEFSGKALTPHTLIGALAGKGQLALGNVTLSGVSPKAVSDVSDAALQGKGPGAGEPLVEALKTSLKANALKLGKVTIPVEIADAHLKLARVEVEMPEGRAVFDTIVDLQTLYLDSGWKVEGKTAVRAAPSVEGAAQAAGEAAPPKPVAVERKLLPPVSVVYSGRLAGLGTIEPAIVSDALERELAVRRMERDVDELERLRALDQQRAAKERERQQALEAERLRKLEQEKPPVPPDAAAPATQSDQNNGESEAPPVGEPSPKADAVDGNLLPETAEAGAAATAGQAATPDAVPARPVSRPSAPVVKKKPPPKSWQPFQMTPYQ